MTKGKQVVAKRVPMMLLLTGPSTISSKTASRLKSQLKQAISGTALEGTPVVIGGDGLTVQLVVAPSWAVNGTMEGE